MDVTKILTPLRQERKPIEEAITSPERRAKGSKRGGRTPRSLLKKGTHDSE